MTTPTLPPEPPSRDPNDPRWLAYTRGDMSREEAERFERELALGEESPAMPDRRDAAVADPTAREVRAAIGALDTIEARRRTAIAPPWPTPSRGLPVALALAAAALIAVAIWAAWPAPVGEPPPDRIAGADTRPVMIAPADTLAPSDALAPSDVASPELEPEPDATALAANEIGPSDDAEVVVPAPPPWRDAIASARNRRAWTYRDGDLIVTVARHASLETLASSGMLDAIMSCIHGTRATPTSPPPDDRLRVRVSLGAGKEAPFITASASGDELARCVEALPVTGGWTRTPAPFDIRIGEPDPAPAPPGKRKSLEK